MFHLDPVRVRAQVVGRSVGNSSRTLSPTSILRDLVNPPRDPAEGSQTGKRRWGSIQIAVPTREVSAQLVQAHAGKRLLDTLVVDVLDPRIPGHAQVSTTVALHGVVVTHLGRHIMEPVFRRRHTPTGELVALDLIFRAIDVAHGGQGKAAHDDWLKP